MIYVIKHSFGLAIPSITHQKEVICNNVYESLLFTDHGFTQKGGFRLILATVQQLDWLRKQVTNLIIKQFQVWLLVLISTVSSMVTMVVLLKGEELIFGYNVRTLVGQAGLWTLQTIMQESEYKTFLTAWVYPPQLVMKTEQIDYSWWQIFYFLA